jgi:GNAT superfamily N-acetyltransferase
MIENLGYDSSKGLTLVVEKHGTHDQKTHGSWATGLSPDVAGKIVQFTREWGGLSISMKDGSMPTSGYMVAKPPEFSRIVEEADFFDPVKGPKILADYMKTHRQDLGSGKNYLGTWLNEGKVYLDVSENIQDKAEATKVGRERNQKAIWDVVNLAEVDTGGTGLVEKESQHGRVARHLENDRRADRRIRETDSRQTDTIVIKFAPNLKPALKHAEHDQQSHGNWATGEGGKWSAYGSRAGDIAAREGALTRQALDEIFLSMDGEGKSIYDFDDDELQRIIDNDPMLYEAFIDEKNRVMEYFSEEFNIPVENLGNYERDADNDARDAVRDSFRDYIVDEYGSENVFDEDTAKRTMRDAFDYKDEKSGISARVLEVYPDDDGLKVRGAIYAPDGRSQIGEFARTFYQDEGNYRVEHDLFRIAEKEYQGKGFGRGFIENQENTYIAAGLTRINLYSAWDGAYTWSRAGYDFDPERLGESIRNLNNGSWDTGNWSKSDVDKFASLRERSQGNMSDKDFPFPDDYASLPNAKSAMYGERVYFEKILTPEGVRLREGAIDADGDGMIYDGTPRERPAPAAAKPSGFTQKPLFDKP